MKKVVLTFVALLCAAICFAQTCTINGRMNVPEFQDKEVSLINAATRAVVATTTIQDSTFTFNVAVAEPYWGLIKTATVSGRNYYYMNVIVENGTVACDLVTDDLSGTPNNEKYYAFNKEMKYEESVLYAIEDRHKDASYVPEDQAKNLEEDIQRQFEKMGNIAKSYYLVNKDNMVAVMAFNYMTELQIFDYNELAQLLELATPSVRNYPSLVKKMEQLEKLSHTAVGKPYIDLDVKDFKTGKSVKLSKYIKGKIALIDFWASWCRPCRAEIPNIAKIYEKYGKDIVVISLNVWDKPNAQAKSIKDMNMNWVQLTDDTPNATDVYGIDGIPHIMLIGKDGKILARDLRGEEIEAAVKEALK